MFVSLLGVLPTLVKINSMNKSNKVLKHLWMKQKMNMNALLAGMTIIRFKEIKRVMIKLLKMTKIGMKTGNILDLL